MTSPVETGSAGFAFLCHGLTPRLIVRVFIHINEESILEIRGGVKTNIEDGGANAPRLKASRT